MIGLGFAGVGWLGEALIQDLPKFPILALAAVQDTRAELAQRVALQYGAGWHGTRFEDLLQAPGVDALAICTPNALHVPQAQAALRAGKHVLVQKPLGLSHADAEATVSLARDLERLLFVDYSYRFLDTVGALRESAAAPRRLQARFHNIYGPGQEKTWFFDPHVSGGGALMDLGVHLLDLALWLLQPSRVDVQHCELVGEPVEHAARLLVMLDDTPLELEVSWNAPLQATQISLQADDVRWENVDGSFFRFRTVRDEAVLIERETTLREDTLRAFCDALDSRTQPLIDARVYAVLDRAYGRTSD